MTTPPTPGAPTTPGRVPCRCGLRRLSTYTEWLEDDTSKHFPSRPCYRKEPLPPRVPPAPPWVFEALKNLYANCRHYLPDVGSTCTPCLVSALVAAESRGRVGALAAFAETARRLTASPDTTKEGT